MAAKTIYFLLSFSYLVIKMLILKLNKFRQTLLDTQLNYECMKYCTTYIKYWLSNLSICYYVYAFFQYLAIITSKCRPA